MTCRNIPTRTASLTALLCAMAAGPAAADLTGAQVWEDWKSYMSGFGYEVSGSESQSDGTLTVTDVVMSMQFPEEEGSFEVAMESLTFIDNPDGSVSVALPRSMPLSFDVTDDEGQDVKGTLTYAQTEPVLVVAGDPDDLTYTYDAQAVDVTLDDLVVEGEAVPRETMSLALSLGDVTSVTRMQIGDLRTYDQDTTAASLSYDVAFVVPEEDGGGTGSLEGSMQGLTITGAGEVPTQADRADLEAMLEQGFTVSGGFSYEAGRTEIDMRPPEGPLVGSTSSDGGTVEFGMGPQGFRYDVTQTNLAIDMQQVPELPFPVSLQMARGAFNLAMPVRTTEEPQDFALGFTLGDVTITDAIWNLFDPAGQLPRDPATISIDLTGKARLLEDVMDPDVAEEIDPEAVPGEIHALDINDVRISAVGAEVTGSGAFTFDNTDVTTFNGVPKPQGRLDIRIEGANALIDTLVRIGLLPEDQAMGARMMMGLFGVPQGEDVLTSTIEVNEEGHVLANGQRLQ